MIIALFRIGSIIPSATTGAMSFDKRYIPRSGSIRAPLINGRLARPRALIAAIPITPHRASIGSRTVAFFLPGYFHRDIELPIIYRVRQGRAEIARSPDQSSPTLGFTFVGDGPWDARDPIMSAALEDAARELRPGEADGPSVRT